MKSLVIILTVILYSDHVRAQNAVVQDTSCTFLKNLTFKNGVDTVEVKAVYQDFLKGSDYQILKALDREKKIIYKEYGVDTGEVENSRSLYFKPVNCQIFFEGTISKKIYNIPSALKSQNLADYSRTPIKIEDLPIGQIIYLKCLVFEDNRFRDNLGTYFFTIIGLNLDR